MTPDLSLTCRIGDQQWSVRMMGDSIHWMSDRALAYQIMHHVSVALRELQATERDKLRDQLLARTSGIMLALRELSPGHRAADILMDALRNDPKPLPSATGAG